MKRESGIRSAVAIGVATLILLSAAPTFARGRKGRSSEIVTKTVVQRLIVWIQSRMSPPWPEPTPEPTPDPTTDPTGTTSTPSTPTPGIQVRSN